MQAYCHLAVFYLDFNFRPTKFMKFMLSLTFKLAVCVASDDHKSIIACQCQSTFGNHLFDTAFSS